MQSPPSHSSIVPSARCPRRANGLLALAGAVLLTAASSFAQGPSATNANALPEGGSFAMRCGTLLVGDGSTKLDNAWLVVRDGKIERIGTTPPPADLPVVDRSDKVIMPGIVAVDGDLTAMADSEYQVTPDAYAVDAFDFERSWRSVLAGGITTSYLSPARQRLVSGQGSVIKLAGRDIVERVLNDAQCLRVNFGESATKAPRVFEPTDHPTDDDPLKPSRIQLPTARISMLPELRALFAEATAEGAGSVGGEGPSEHRYETGALKAVVEGSMPLRAAATEAFDIRRALQLQKALGLKMVLENPSEIARVAELASEQDVMATFRIPAMFGRSIPGGEDRLQDTPDYNLDAPAKAAAAGMVVGLSPATGTYMRDYLMSVALAVRHGLPEQTAMRAIGIDAARILGVEQRVGSLEPGKDADFVVLSGEPLAVGSMVEATWIDGKRCYARKTDSQVLAIRAGRVLDGTGRVLRNGVVLIQNGRIKAVGEELSIPYGATVLDLPEATATPGFVDTFSHLGLAGEGTGVPTGTGAQRLDEVLRADDPMFEPALRAGVTALLVAGKDRSLASGRLTAIKTGASDRDGMLLRPIAGQRMVFDGIGPNATKPLEAQIGKARKYVAAWKKYEKALADWQAGEKNKPAPEPEPEPKPGEKAKVDPINGVWEAELELRPGFALQITLDLKRNGTKVTGTLSISLGGRGGPPPQEIEGTFDNGKLVIEFSGMGGDGKLEATVDGDTLTGSFDAGPMGSREITGTRTSKTAGSGSSSKGRARSRKKNDDGRPKAPKTDENLEPMRAVIAGKATLVVRTNRAPAIESVVALLEKEKLDYVLTGADDLLDDGTPLAGNKPGIIVGPEVVVEDDGELVNVASTFADHDLPIMFGTGNAAGTRFLPLHATYAVRYGLSPQDALMALTAWPAKAFHLDDRIGSLEKGKDADVVLFSGNPFEPQSRVLLVVCNGRVVVDNREDSE
ncbi:MAG: amidohydrolase family protein [Planctomycetota bacterium]